LKALGQKGYSHPEDELKKLLDKTPADVIKCKSAAKIGGHPQKVGAGYRLKSPLNESWF
jgi:hypothetical protein